MKWEKLGHIFSPRKDKSWNQSHASVPTVDVIDEAIWRIYYATRDETNRSHISYIEVEAGNPGNIIYEHPEPIMTPGILGRFDDCGVMPSWIITIGNVKYLYYIGWTVRQTIPYHNAIGLAISKDGGKNFERFAAGPLFASTWKEPYFTGTSCVLIEDGVWKNWYMSCTKWEVFNGQPEPFYHIKYAESSDGINWERKGLVAIDYATEAEGGIVRASVLKENEIYKMWYAYRNGYDYRENRKNSYRIGYAESANGVAWTRKDNLVGIDISESGWDSVMICYPCVVVHKGRKYMFYNGNTFGQNGFGYAVLNSE